MSLYFEIFQQSGFGFVDVFRQMASGNTLLRSRGDGTFEDVTKKAGANPVGWFWAASFADFDNDGWQDIYAADSWAGADLLNNSRGVAVADFWNRGVMDIAVSASTGKTALLRNEIENKRNWLQIKLGKSCWVTGTRSRTPCCCASATKCGGRPDYRDYRRPATVLSRSTTG
jgi:hypothetical protein